MIIRRFFLCLLVCLMFWNIDAGYGESEVSPLRTLVLPAEATPASLWTEQAQEFRQLANLKQPECDVKIFTDDIGPGKAHTPAIIWGRKNKYLQKTGEDIILLNLKEEEFYLGWAEDRKYLLVYGGSDRSEFYALRELIRLGWLNWDDIFTIQQKYTPAFAYRLVSEVSGTNPFKEALYRGYNTILVNHNASQTSEFKELLTPMFDESGLKRTQKNQEELSLDLKNAKYCFLDTFTMGDEFEFPHEILDHPLAARLVELDFDWKSINNPFGEARIFCMARPEFWRFYRMKYSEFIDRFPQVDDIMIRLGENSSYNTEYIGHGVYPYYNTPFCDNCSNLSEAERVALLINKSYETIVKNGNKTYIQRTWDPDYNSWHSDPELYREVVSLLDNTDKLIFSTKYTISDFWRYQAPNPTLSVEGPKRIVEFQCTREYDGKGAFPAWMGEEYASAYRRAQTLGAAGVWNWHHGGGNDLPSVKIDIWNQANAYVVDRLMWNPMANPLILAKEFAELHFGKESVSYIYRILKLSSEASAKMLYFSILGDNRTVETPDNTWIRDDVIRGEKWLAPILLPNLDKLEEIIAEKNEAIDIINTMCNEAYLVAPKISRTKPEDMMYGKELSGAPLADFVSSSMEYQRQLSVVLRDFVAAYGYYLRWQENGNASDKDRAMKYAEDWKISWEKYQNEIPLLPESASPYRDDGMEETIVKVIKRLNENYKSYRFGYKIIGPFPNSHGDGFDKVYPPENEIVFSATYEGISGQEVEWRELPDELLPGWAYVDFDRCLEPNNWVAAYAYTTFNVSEGGEAILQIGSDDGIKIWLNGEEVYALDTSRGAVEDEDQIKVNLVFR